VWQRCQPCSMHAVRQRCWMPALPRSKRSRKVHGRAASKRAASLLALAECTCTLRIGGRLLSPTHAVCRPSSWGKLCMHVVDRHSVWDEHCTPESTGHGAPAGLAGGQSGPVQLHTAAQPLGAGPGLPSPPLASRAAPPTGQPHQIPPICELQQRPAYHRTTLDGPLQKLHPRALHWSGSLHRNPHQAACQTLWRPDLACLWLFHLNSFPTRYGSLFPMYVVACFVHSCFGGIQRHLRHCHRSSRLQSTQDII
jgi:hypothetical protein